MNKMFSIQKAQIFEYDFAHIIDKPAEAITGFIHVLPGAFSGYRYEALMQQSKSIEEIEKYLNNKHFLIKDLNIFQKSLNLYDPNDDIRVYFR